MKRKSVVKKVSYRLAWIVIAVFLFLINAPLFASERGDIIESYAKRTYIFVTYLMGTVVTVQDGALTSHGEASSTAEKDLITEYAKDVDGVKDVKNLMTVAMKPGEKTMGEDFIDDVSITAMVKTTLLYHRSTSGLNTTVETKDGVVTLGGRVKNAAEKEFAAKIVSDVHGVKEVINDMIIE
jgi:osmotically-inducible protein OsmY